MLKISDVQIFRLKNSHVRCQFRCLLLCSLVYLLHRDMTWMLLRCHYWRNESTSLMLSEISTSSLTASCRCRHRFQPCVLLAMTSSDSCVRLFDACLSPNEDAVKTLIQAFINTRLDGCNLLYFGIADGLISRLQSVQNAAARLITGVRRCEHITPVLH